MKLLSFLFLLSLLAACHMQASRQVVVAQHPLPFSGDSGVVLGAHLPWILSTGALDTTMYNDVWKTSAQKDTLGMYFRSDSNYIFCLTQYEGMLLAEVNANGICLSKELVGNGPGCGVDEPLRKEGNWLFATHCYSGSSMEGKVCYAFKHMGTPADSAQLLQDALLRYRGMITTLDGSFSGKVDTLTGVYDLEQWSEDGTHQLKPIKHITVNFVFKNSEWNAVGGDTTAFAEACQYAGVLSRPPFP